MLTSYGHPRWTIKRLILAAITFYVAVCFLYDMPLFSSKLPQYSGPYKVGVVDIETPVEKRKISDAVLKDSGKPAFELETVLFSLYYPAIKEPRSSKPHHPWVPDIQQHAEGYARFAGISNPLVNSVFGWALWTLVGSTTVPANVDVPLSGTRGQYHDYVAETPIGNEGLPRLPVIVFSHGMASGRTSYTQWCGELASLGFVVAAIEHRDGSGPGTSVMRGDGGSREVFHISQSMLEPQPEISAFKAMQLAMRQAEVEETVKVLHQLNDGHGRTVYKSNSRLEGEDLEAWKGRLDMDRVVVGGHSYGATLALQALKGAPCEARPFAGGIILDPGKQSGALNDDIDVPILVVHSQSWSSKYTLFHGQPHFEVVRDLVKKVMRKEEGRKQRFAWFLTAKGTSHPSVTDAPLIEPRLLAWTTGSTINAKEGVMQYVKVSKEFMRYLEDGHRTGVLAEDVTHPAYDEDVTDPKRKKKMSHSIVKYWQIHVAPSTECPFPGMCGVEREARG